MSKVLYANNFNFMSQSCDKVEIPNNKDENNIQNIVPNGECDNEQYGEEYDDEQCDEEYDDEQYEGDENDKLICDICASGLFSKCTGYPCGYSESELQKKKNVNEKIKNTYYPPYYINDLKLEKEDLENNCNEVISDDSDDSDDSDSYHRGSCECEGTRGCPHY